MSCFRCNVCGEWIYKGKKFNSRKETVTNEEYLGIKIFRYVPQAYYYTNPQTRHIHVSYSSLLLTAPLTSTILDSICVAPGVVPSLQ